MVVIIDVFDIELPVWVVSRQLINLVRLKEAKCARFGGLTAASVKESARLQNGPQIFERNLAVLE